MKKYLAFAVFFSVISANAAPCAVTFILKNDSVATLKMNADIKAGAPTAYWQQKPSANLASHDTTFASLIFDSKSNFSAYINAAETSKVACNISLSNGAGSKECELTIVSGCSELTYTIKNSGSTYTINYK
jgi:hypothetical protein